MSRPSPLFRRFVPLCLALVVGAGSPMLVPDSAEAQSRREQKKPRQQPELGGLHPSGVGWGGVSGVRGRGESERENHRKD